MVLASSDGNKTATWSAENEEIAQKQLKSGELKRYWIVHARRAFKCCGQKNYNEMDDYDSDDDVNASLAIRCEPGKAC